jgi:hypothetical protein
MSGSDVTPGRKRAKLLVAVLGTIVTIGATVVVGIRRRQFASESLLQFHGLPESRTWEARSLEKGRGRVTTTSDVDARAMAELERARDHLTREYWQSRVRILTRRAEAGTRISRLEDVTTSCIWHSACRSLE